MGIKGGSYGGQPETQRARWETAYAKACVVPEIVAAAGVS
jgi:hypothetical protein